MVDIREQLIHILYESRAGEVINFPKCEKSRSVPDLWMLQVSEDKVDGANRYAVPVRTQDYVSGYLYFTTETLPDYIKDPISIIKTWYDAHKGSINTQYEVGVVYSPDKGTYLMVRPSYVPEEFESIGWLMGNPYAPLRIYVVGLTWDQLLDLYENGPKLSQVKYD